MMRESRLSQRVSDVADRLRRLRTLRLQSTLWLAGTVAGLLLLAANLWPAVPGLSAPLTLLAGGLLLLGGWIVSRRRSPTLHEAANAIESRWPNLDSRLLTAVDQRPDQETGDFNFLQQEVISETISHAYRHDWQDAVPAQELVQARLKQVASLLMFAGAFATAAWVAHARPTSSADSLLAGADAAGSASYAVTVEPGDTSIERDSGVLVIARFDGRLPGDVILHATDAAGTTTSFPLSRSLDDPLFGGRIPSVERDLSYHVEFDEQQSEAYRITVFDYPRLEQADAIILRPEYTGLGEKTIEDVRRVSVIEGSRLTLICRLNKPVDDARLRADDGTELELAATDREDQTVRTVTLTPVEKQTFELLLTDAEGRTNKHPPKFMIDVIPNRPPELAVAFPAKDVRVSPLEEVSLEARAQDDFGLKEYGLIYQLPDSDEQALKLGDSGGADEQVQFAHQLEMEAAHAEPNELVAYYFYADDVGPDGGLRRTFSDLYFAEIRHFDEEYRQDNSSSSQGQPGNMPGETPSSQLLQLQRDIVNATWNLLRREQETEPSAEYAGDAQTIAESQQEAIEMGQGLQSRQEDVLAQQFLRDALEDMEAALALLSRAAETPSIDPLPDARRAANEAYRNLVKLNVREHLVRQSQQSQSQSQQGRDPGDLNRQLQQLELDNNRNRYETEQQDQPPADQEQLQVLNRLRELARRQGDLNEKIRELENALRAAQSEEQREEIERQLKRLQEEQQQLMRDLDELQERMSNEQNRSRMADAREQAHDVREQLRQSSSALKEGQTSKALAAGTRAERELNEMKDQLREQTAGQFADTMQELRREARELAEQQQRLADELAGDSQEKLSGPPQLKVPESHDLTEDFAKQQERLGKLMDKLKEVIQEAELNEPLLSKTLYDAVRETRSDRPEQALADASQFLRHGLNREAARAEEQARAGIDKLREGIEQAAENVLGNEVESLRRAQQELDELSRAIGSELAQADPKSREASQQPESDGSQSSPAASEKNSDEPQTRGDSSRPPAEEQDDQRPGGKPGDQPGRESSQSSESPGAGGQRGEPSQSGQSSGQQPGHTEAQESPQSGGQRTGGQRQAGLSNFLQSGGADGGGGGPHEGGPHPLTGEDFTQWSDRMRDVEEMVDDPDLRAQVAQIRDRARQVRIDVKRHSQSPNWGLVRTSIYGPMLELRDRLAEEIARREPTDEVVPLDRDPVPDRYADLVEQYYQRLGSGR